MATTKKVLLKVIILGESGVGKTALLHKYVSGQFIEHHKATIGADFMTKEIKIDDKLITLQMWDTAGQERFKSLGNSFYRGADAAILVYDLTDKATFEKIDEWRDSFMRLASEKADEFPVLLLGNKHDLETQRQVSADEGAQKASDQMIFFETSAMNGKNIEAAIKKLADNACKRNTAPIFSADVIKQLELPKEDDTADAGGCGCQLL